MWNISENWYETSWATEFEMVTLSNSFCFRRHVSKGFQTLEHACLVFYNAEKWTKKSYAFFAMKGNLDQALSWQTLNNNLSLHW